MDTANINDAQKVDKKKGWLKILIIFIIALIVIPLGVLSILYNFNQTFKKKANEFLSKAPGAVGEYFSNIPTEVERMKMINYLANYYLDLDSSTAAEKIYILKKDDEKLYVDLIKSMNSSSSVKTEEILNKIRNMELRNDLLFSVYDEVLKEEEERLNSEVTRIERQDILLSKNEIEHNYNDKEFIKILEKVDSNILGEILYYIEPELKDYILNSFNINKKNDILDVINKKAEKVSNLEEIAKVYETKPLNVALETLGNTDTYSMEDLAVIYSNLPVIKSAEILSNIEDQNFVKELFTNIIRYERLQNLETDLTQNISKGIKFFNEYNKKINELATIYDKMSSDAVAKIVEKMIANTKSVTSIELESENILQISDRDIILDVFEKLKKQNQSKILELMEPEAASELTRLLASPRN